MSVAQQLVTRFSQLPGRWLRCPHCAQRGASLYFEREHWRWQCRTCRYDRLLARRKQQHGELSTLIASGQLLRARCFKNEDPRDLAYDVRQWTLRQEVFLRKRLGAAWVERVRSSRAPVSDAPNRSAPYNADAALDSSIATRLSALEEIARELDMPPESASK